MLSESKMESERCAPVISPLETGFMSEADDQFPDELILTKFVSSREKAMQSLDQIQAFPRPSTEAINPPQYLYLTTTASSSDQVIDNSAPAFPIKEFEDFKKPNKALEPNPEPDKVQTCEDGLTLNTLKTERFNSVIKEDKEKRKVIVEWVNNNEWSCKQWSCKKFGKEGAAKRAIQFLEKIHGITISCLPEGYYSTLLELGSLESSSKPAHSSRRGSTNCSDKGASKKRSKAIQSIRAQRSDSPPPLGSSPDPWSPKLHQGHESQTVNLIQKIMLLFSPLDSDFFETKEEAVFDRARSHKNEQFDWERLHSNCRRQLRRLVLDSTRNKRFLLDEYSLLLSQVTHTPGIVEFEQTEGNHYQFVDKCLLDSLLGVKTVRDVLNKTVRSELKLYYAAKDIMQIISEGQGEDELAGFQASGAELTHWDKLIESGSRINDDLQCLLEGGLPGHSSLVCSNYGNGFFQFNGGELSSSISKASFNAMINHKRSCMNLVHIDIQGNGYRCLFPNYNERRRIATRLQGKTQGPESCEFAGISPSKLSEMHSTLRDNNNIGLSEGRHVGSGIGGKMCMQMLNGIYTLLDLKYRVKGGQSKEILCDVFRGGRLCYEYKRKSYGTGNFEGQRDSEGKTVRKRRLVTDSGGGGKMQRLDQEKAELRKSRIEWWKKPRGWKVTYYNKEGDKCCQIFRVSLNSSSIERESQYRLAYSFYLSTQHEAKEGGEMRVESREMMEGEDLVGANNENSNTINGGNITCGAGIENTVHSNFMYGGGVPGIFNAVNLMQMLSTGIQPRGFLASNNVPVIGNLLALNYCFPGVLGGCNAPLFGVGVSSGPSSMVQGDHQAFNHLGLESHAGVVPPCVQKPYQPYTAFLPPMHPFMMPMFPSLMQGFSLNQHQNGEDGAVNDHNATGWYGSLDGGTRGESVAQASSDIAGGRLV